MLGFSMTREQNASEVKDVGDIFLTFVVMFVVAVLATVAILSTLVSDVWAVLIAVPIGIGIGWVSSLSRHLRRTLSAIVDVLSWVGGGPHGG